jgi:hypothetical protein
MLDYRQPFTGFLYGCLCRNHMRPIPDCCGPVSGTLRTDVGQGETPGLPQGTES